MATGTLPALGTIAPGTSRSVEVRFAAGAGAPGAASLLRITGTYEGGTFGGSTRVTVP